MSRVSEVPKPLAPSIGGCPSCAKNHGFCQMIGNVERYIEALEVPPEVCDDNEFQTAGELMCNEVLGTQEEALTSPQTCSMFNYALAMDTVSPRRMIRLQENGLRCAQIEHVVEIRDTLVARRRIQ